MWAAHEQRSQGAQAVSFSNYKPGDTVKDALCWSSLSHIKTGVDFLNPPVTGSEEEIRFAHTSLATELEPSREKESKTWDYKNQTVFALKPNSGRWAWLL